MSPLREYLQPAYKDLRPDGADHPRAWAFSDHRSALKNILILHKDFFFFIRISVKKIFHGFL